MATGSSALKESRAVVHIDVWKEVKQKLSELDTDAEERYWEEMRQRDEQLKEERQKARIQTIATNLALKYDTPAKRICFLDVLKRLRRVFKLPPTNATDQQVLPSQLGQSELEDFLMMARERVSLDDDHLRVPLPDDAQLAPLIDRSKVLSEAMKAYQEKKATIQEFSTLKV